MKNKKAQTAVFVNMLIGIAALIIAYVIFSGIKSIELNSITNQIKETDKEVTEEYILNNYLRTEISEGMTFADLINLIYVDTENKDGHKEIFEKETTDLFNKAFGEENWQLKLIKENEVTMDFGEVKGEAKSYQTIIPTMDKKTVQIVLITT